MESKASTCTMTMESRSCRAEVVEERRGFVKKMAVTTVALGVGVAATQFSRFMAPNVLYEPSKVFKLGALSQFPIGSRTVIDGRGIEVVRAKDGVHVISLVCTHLGCLVNSVENNPEIGYACPCHGSNFTPSGKVLGGAAPTDLPWYELYLDHTGTLVVDTSRVNSKRTKLVV